MNRNIGKGIPRNLPWPRKEKPLGKSLVTFAPLLIARARPLTVSIVASVAMKGWTLSVLLIQALNRPMQAAMAKVRAIAA